MKQGDIASVKEWISEMLQSALHDGTRTYRAISELVLQILGLETSSFGNEISTEQLLSEKDLDIVLDTLATTRNAAAESLWVELALTQTQFLLAREDVVRDLLLSVQGEVDDLIWSRGEFDPMRIESLSNMISVLIRKCITPPNAAIAFDSLLKMMELYPTLRRDFVDEVFASLVERIPPTTTLAEGAVNAALRVGGIETRKAVAMLAPHACLRDKSTEVRSVAMTSLLKKPYLVPAYGNFILQSCLPFATTEDGETDRIMLGDLELADAAAPVLGMLGVMDSMKLSQCVDRLIRGAIISTENSCVDAVGENILKALTHIARNGNLGELTQYIYHSNRRNVAYLLKISPAWNELAMSIGYGGYLAAMDKKVVVLPTPTATTASSHYVNLDDVVTSNTATTEGAAFIMKDAEMLFDAMTYAERAGNLMESLRYAQLIKTRHSNLWKERNLSTHLVSHLLPAIAQRLLPQPISMDADGFSVFSLADLKEFEKFVNIMREIQLIAAEESEVCLGLSTRYIDFARGKMLQVVADHGSKEARKFLTRENIRSPLLLGMLDQVDAGNLTVSRTTSSTATSIDVRSAKEDLKVNTSSSLLSETKAASPRVAKANKYAIPLKTKVVQAPAVNDTPLNTNYLFVQPSTIGPLVADGVPLNTSYLSVAPSTMTFNAITNENKSWQMLSEKRNANPVVSVKKEAKSADGESRRNSVGYATIVTPAAPISTALLVASVPESTKEAGSVVIKKTEEKEAVSPEEKVAEEKKAEDNTNRDKATKKKVKVAVPS
jgi:hypothetical protein